MESLSPEGGRLRRPGRFFAVSAHVAFPREGNMRRNCKRESCRGSASAWTQLLRSPASAHPTRGKNCAICYNESGNFSSQAIWSARQNHVDRLTTCPSLFVFHRSLQGDQPCPSHVSPPTLLARPGPGVLATQGSTTIARTAYGALCSCVTIAQSSAVHFNSVSF